MNSRKTTGQRTFLDSWRDKAQSGPSGSSNQFKGSPMRGRGVYGSARGASTGSHNSESDTMANKSKRGRGRGRGRSRGRGNNFNFSNEVVNLDDDEDELCQQALGQFELANSEIGKAFAAGLDVTDIPGFERAAGEVWIYPTNRSVRDYQFNMVNTALFHNTLVCLPTGLGKTFIAAVVMFNFHRWYPDEIIVFMAPTRPLVTQQLDACHNIVGINPSVTVELTGQTSPVKREELWKEKKVFFLTPQVMQSDISRGSCPAEKVRCVVIDEAHKALGNHSYAQVVSAIAQVNKQFRVLALSATPGNDLTAIQQVFRNLLISRVELRSENSPDVLPYIHDREMETRVVNLDPFLLSIHEQIKEIFQVYTGKLMKQKILPRNGSSFVPFQLLQARQRFRTCPPPQCNPMDKRSAEITFSVCISLAKAIDLLNFHGLRSFYSFLHAILLKQKGNPVVAFELRKHGLEEMLSNIQQKLNISVENSSFNISASGLFESQLDESGDTYVEQIPSSNLEDYLQSHPKMRVLKELVTKHFQDSVTANKPTKIMIFSQYRDSVQEIGNMLNLLNPGTIKPMVFMGQAKTGGAGGRGLKQKEQLQVVEKFKKGGFNVLVATSVGEEGLDIGEVDLIICFDSNRSPTRNVQRMGRTGRQRQGKIIFLLTAGKEERLYRASVVQQKSISKNITDPEKLFPFLFQVSPRMVPRGVEPECFKMNIILSTEQESYSNKRKHKIATEDDEEVLRDDSDFMPAPKIDRKDKKKTKVTLPKKKTSGQKQTEHHQTLAQCLELMESKRSQNLLNSTKNKKSDPPKVETITIDDENNTPAVEVVNIGDQFPLNTSYNSQPIVEYHDFMELDFPDVDDDYEFICTLFDVQEITAQSSVPPCIQVPLPTNLEINWKEEYNSISMKDILLKEMDLECLREKVDTSIYVSSLQKYCKCGNANGSVDILSDGDDFNNHGFVPEDLGSDFSNVTPQQNSKNGFLSFPYSKKTPLAEIQPVAELSIQSGVKNVFPSPRFTVSPQRSPVKNNFPGGTSFTAGEAKTSTPLSYPLNHRNLSVLSMSLTNESEKTLEISKQCIKRVPSPSVIKTQFEESFNAGFVFDENDPILHEEWDTDMDVSTTQPCGNQSIYNKITTTAAKLNTSVGKELTAATTVPTATVSDQSKTITRTADVNVILCTDDSSTASESEFDSFPKTTTQSNQPNFTFISKSSNRSEELSTKFSTNFGKEKQGQSNTNQTRAQHVMTNASGNNTCNFNNQYIRKASINTSQDIKRPQASTHDSKNSSGSSIEVPPDSPDLGLKRKFVFKKRTSGNSTISPVFPLNTTTTARQNIENTQGTKGNSCEVRQLEKTSKANHNHVASNNKNSNISATSTLKIHKRGENPHEIFSVIYDEDVNCIPGTSSSEDEIDRKRTGNVNCILPVTNDVVKDNEDDTDFDSDETHWDPNERIPVLPSTPIKPTKGKQNYYEKPSSNEIGDSVFSPLMQNFKLSSYRNLSSQAGASTSAVSRTLNFLPVKKTSQMPTQDIPSTSVILKSASGSNTTKLQQSCTPASMKPQQPVVNPLRIFPSHRIKLPDSSLESFNSPMLKSIENQSHISEAPKSSLQGSDLVSSKTESQKSFKYQALQWSSPVFKPSSKFCSGVASSTAASVSRFRFKSSSSKLVTNDELNQQTSGAKPPSAKKSLISLSPEESYKTRCISPTEEEFDEDLLLLSSFQSPNINASTPSRSTILLTPNNSVTTVEDIDSPDVAVVRRSNNVKKRIIHSDERIPNQRSPIRTSKNRVRRKNPFVLHEADGTSDDSSVDIELDDLNDFGDDGDPFVVQEGDDEDLEDSYAVSSTQQQAMYLQSVKDVVPVRAGRIEEPLRPPSDYGLNYYDESEYDLNDSFCTTEVEYADVGVYTQCMIAAREHLDNEKKSGNKQKRKLRRGR